jgi:hypothetical protein
MHLHALYPCSKGIQFDRAKIGKEASVRSTCSSHGVKGDRGGSEDSRLAKAFCPVTGRKEACGESASERHNREPQPPVTGRKETQGEGNDAAARTREAQRRGRRNRGPDGEQE